jgi:hypothetical protein
MYQSMFDRKVPILFELKECFRLFPFKNINSFQKNFFLKFNQKKPNEKFQFLFRIIDGASYSRSSVNHMAMYIFYFI